MADITGGGAAVFNGELCKWPDMALSISNIPIDEKAFVRCVATEFFKNQSINNPRAQAIESINNAKILYSQLKAQGYMDE